MRTFDLLLDPLAGTHVLEAARLTVAAREFDDRICGFVFNGVVIRCFRDETPEQLVAEYEEMIKRK